MPAAVGESLHLTLTLSGTVWTQTVVGNGGQVPPSVSFDEDLVGQSQNRALFVIEGYSCEPVSDVVFTDTTITFDSPDLADCSVVQRGREPSSWGKRAPMRHHAPGTAGAER